MSLTGMKMLEEAGLIATRKVGRPRHCRLGPQRLEDRARLRRPARAGLQGLHRPRADPAVVGTARDDDHGREFEPEPGGRWQFRCAAPRRPRRPTSVSILPSSGLTLIFAEVLPVQEPQRLTSPSFAVAVAARGARAARVVAMPIKVRLAESAIELPA
jgi:hypothetical protein